jgi:hypothetical protein
VLAPVFAAWGPDYRTGLSDFQNAFRAAHPGGGSFASADPALQLAYLTTVDRTPFFETTRMLTLVGMFSAPKYGGNVNGAGWKMIQFEDRHTFAPPFGHYDAQYQGFEYYPVKPA